MINDMEKARAANGIQLLLAEDDLTNQYVFRTILSVAGYAVDIVENGLLACERAPLVRPRLILLDMMMPVMDGYEAAARLCRMPELDDVPIVALTAKAMKGDREKTLAAGCDGYLSKPVSARALLAAVQEWLVKPHEEWFPTRLARREERAA